MALPLRTTRTTENAGSTFADSAAAMSLIPSFHGVSNTAPVSRIEKYDRTRFREPGRSLEAFVGVLAGGANRCDRHLSRAAHGRSRHVRRHPDRGADRFAGQGHRRATAANRRRPDQGAEAQSIQPRTESFDYSMNSLAV